MPEFILDPWQAAPAANTDVNLGTVPTGRAVVSSIFTVCNRGTVEGRFRMAIRPGGAALAPQHYHYFDALLGANASFVLDGGLTMAAGTIVTVRASTAEFSFNLCRSEVTV